MVLINARILILTYKEETMWQKPAFEDLRLGMEITLYISNR